MPEKIVKQHYIALVKLLKIYRSSPLDENLLRVSHSFCKNLYATAKTHPDLIFAQPQLYKPQLPFIVNLTFNSAVLTCLLAVRNKCDPSVTIQLMCGSLSIYALEQSAIQKHYQSDKDSQKLATKDIGLKNTKFSKLLETNQQQIWLANYLLCPHIHLTHYPHAKLNTPITALAYLANKFALLCTPNKHKPAISFANAIKHLSLTSCSKWYSLIVPLLKYPGISPLGSYIRLRDGSIHIVLSQSVEGLVTKALPTKQPIAVPVNKIQLTQTEHVIFSYPSQPLKSFTRLNQWWSSDLMDWLTNNKENNHTTPFNSILPTQAAPASLLIIQDQLKHNNTDITVIAKAIEQEPDFAQQLQVSASKSNRKKNSVQSIQHSLAMLGFERANSILLQHSLLSRLNQQYFPLQQALLTFSQLLVFIVGELATRTKGVSPELASTTAYFAVSRLFTLPSIRALNHWELPSSPTFKVASLIKIKEAEKLKYDGFLLAKAWQQNEQILDVLQHYDLGIPKQEKKRSTRQYCYLLGLSLTLAQEHYFSGTTRCKETELYFKAGLIELNMSQAEVTNLISSANFFCQLE